MRTRFGGRTLARSQALQLLFQAEANKLSVEEVLAGEYALSEGPLDPYARELALGTDAVCDDLDDIISLRSTSWAIGRINAVDRNLLRIALYEILDVDEVDVAVAIDECVELAKAFGTDESSRFVNGLLGRVVDDIEAGVDVIAAARAAALEREAADEAVEDEADSDASDAAIEVEEDVAGSGVDDSDAVEAEAVEAEAAEPVADVVGDGNEDA